MTNIIIAFPNAENGKNIKNILVRSGFAVTCVCTSGAQALMEAHSLQDGILISAYRLPDMLYRNLKDDLPPDFQMIMISSKAQWDENRDSDVISLSMPLKVHELVSTLEMVTYSIERQRKRRKAEPKKRSEEEKDIINQAKELLMYRNNMSEEEAHRYLQKTSMNSGNSFTDTAQMILSMLDS